jgi:hypothetical protein
MIITRRYQYKGPWPLDLKNASEKTLVLPPPMFMIAYDVVFEDAICSVDAMDERMRHYGCFPEPVDTIVNSPSPYIGIISPNGTTWKLDVDDAGTLSVVKVS